MILETKVETRNSKKPNTGEEPGSYLWLSLFRGGSVGKLKVFGKRIFDHSLYENFLNSKVN